MTTYTHKNEKVLDNWMFHKDYFTEETRFLPKSIQAELAKRLTQCARNPLTEDQLKDINPVIEVKLKNICDAYKNKQERSRIAAAKKRAAAVESESEDEEDEEDEVHDEDKHIEFKNFMSNFRTRFGV